MLRLARENPTWGYRRIHGELLVLAVTVAPSTVWEILHQAGINPAPERSATTWADFLRTQAHALLAADFIETVTLTGTRMYIPVCGRTTGEGDRGEIIQAPDPDITHPTRRVQD